MFLKGNLDKVLMNGKGPFFHWLLSRISLCPSLFSDQVPSKRWWGLSTGRVNPDSWQVLILPAFVSQQL